MSAKLIGMEINMSEYLQIEQNKDEFSQWHEDTENKVFFGSNNTKVTKKIKSGPYKIIDTSKGIALRAMDLIEINYAELNNISKQIINDVNQFWQSKDLFKQCKLVHKRGFLLYGPPGTGKSTIINHIVQDFTLPKNNGVAIYFDDDIQSLIEILKMFRRIEKTRNIMVIMEDFESICENEHTSKLLNLLDGADQIEHIVFIATTNHIEKIENRFINRPSRFDKKYEVTTLSKEATNNYITSLFKEFGINDKQKQNNIIKSCNNLTCAEIKEVFISNILFKNSLETIVKDIKKLRRV